MKISLFQGILIAVFGLGALLGLFVFATYTSTSSSKGVGTVVIWGTLPAAEINAALTASTKADRSLKSVSYVQKSETTLASDLATAIATSKAPDLVLASQEDLASLAPLLTPIPASTLPASTFTSTFAGEGNLFALPSGAGFYGVPYLIDPLVLYTNNAILSSSGIAEPPTTWEALTGLVPTLARLTSNQQIVRALIALGTYDNVHDARAILSMLFLQTGVPITTLSAGGQMSANLGVQASSQGGEAPGAAVLGFYTQFADPSKVSYTWNESLPDSQQSFLSGDSALYLGFASEASYLAAANPHLSFSVSPVPQPATAVAKATYGLAYAFMIPRGAANSSGAYQAAAILSGATEQVAAALSTGLAPAVRATLASPPSDPTAAVAYESALYAGGWLSPAPAATDPVFSAMINSVISGRLSVSSALSSAERSLAALLQ